MVHDGPFTRAFLSMLHALQVTSMPLPRSLLPLLWPVRGFAIRSIGEEGLRYGVGMSCRCCCPWERDAAEPLFQAGIIPISKTPRGSQMSRKSHMGGGVGRRDMRACVLACCHSRMYSFIRHVLRTPETGCKVETGSPAGSHGGNKVD